MILKVPAVLKSIAAIFGLLPSALELVDIKDGCVIVTFLIPASVADAIFTPDTVFTSQQEDKLRAVSLLWLKCNGCTINFGEKKLQKEVHTENPGKKKKAEVLLVGIADYFPGWVKHCRLHDVCNTTKGFHSWYMPQHSL